MSTLVAIDRFNLLDYTLLLLFLFSFISGYRLGLLQSLFKAVGYVLGGLGGVYIALNYLDQFDSKYIKLLLTLLLILLSATLLESTLGKLGLLLHKGLLIAPLKLLDSLFGGILSVLKNLIIFFLIASVLLFTPFKQPTNYINTSYLYSYLDTHLPKIFTEIKDSLDTLI
jgi:uncharacterized membrane protein required for colicin V production